MKTKIALFTLLVAFIITSTAQERYNVEYDYKTDTFSYQKVKDDGTMEVLEKPKMKRNSMVKIHLKNVNPFALDIKPIITSENVFVEGNTYNLNSLFGNLRSNTADPNTIGLNISTPTFADASKNNLTSNSITRSEASEINKTIANEIKATNTLNKKIITAKDVFIANLTNPNLSKGEIKMQLETILSDIVTSDNTPEDDFYAYLNDVRDELNNKNSIIKNNVGQMTTLFRKQQSNLYSNSENNLIEANTLVTETEKTIKTSLTNVETLQKLYAMLEASSFEQITDYEIVNDKTTIDLQFKKSAFLQEVDIAGTGDVVKDRSIKLYATGGFKINTSVALTLNNFGENSSDFYLDGTNQIGADKNDYFVPSLATMINFYPFAGESVNIGGSFGLSIPITDKITGVNFLLGPTLFFGSKNRLSVSGGIAYGPVERLKDGLQVGDTTNRASNEITKNVYDFGYFFGISFSLFDVKK